MADNSTSTPISGTATLYFEQVTEQHDPNPHDKTVEMTTLPGMVDVYIDFGGGKLKLTQFPASKVIDAQAAAKKSSKSSS